MPERYQPLEIFITGNHERCSDEAVEDRRVLRALFAQRLRGQSTEERREAFNHSTSQRGYLRTRSGGCKRILAIPTRRFTCKSAEQSSNALPLWVCASSSHQKNCTKRHTQQPPISCAHVFSATSRGVVRPSIMSSMWLYGQAVESPHTCDHQTVSRNRKIA